MYCVLVLNAVQFAAKRSAFWCKTQGKMPLNARQNGAKHSAKWCKMRGGMNKNALKWYKQNLLDA